MHPFCFSINDVYGRLFPGRLFPGRFFPWALFSMGAFFLGAFFRGRFLPWALFSQIRRLHREQEQPMELNAKANQLHARRSLILNPFPGTGGSKGGPMGRSPTPWDDEDFVIDAYTVIIYFTQHIKLQYVYINILLRLYLCGNQWF